ncbi:MAG: nucleotidyltransferase family protein [Flavobacteriales bacterium]|nr:nucleotidyltransferase family protein [Flavobacteriales bacterium]
MRIICNPDPDLGRAHSLRLGLAALPSVRYCFVQNIDNPFVDPELIGALYAAREQAPYVTPEHLGPRRPSGAHWPSTHRTGPSG